MRQVATIGAQDVLFALAFPPYSQPVVDAVMEAPVVGRRIVTLTDGPDRPLARHSEVALYLGTDAASRFQPVSGAMALVQTLVTAITRP